MNSHLILRYRQCHSAEEVEAMQETIQQEMEEASLRRKKEMSACLPPRSPGLGREGIS